MALVKIGEKDQVILMEGLDNAPVGLSKWGSERETQEGVVWQGFGGCPFIWNTLF